MHRAQTLRWLTVVLAGVMGTLVFAQSPTPISFANLPKGDTLHIRYSAWNCFLSEAAEFVYKGGKIGVFTVTESIPQPLNSEWVSLSRGRIFLDPDEPAKLDALLKWYRESPYGNSDLFGVTDITLQIEQRRGARIIAIEFLRCNRLSMDAPTLTFGVMLDALRPRHLQLQEHPSL